MKKEEERKKIKNLWHVRKLFVTFVFSKIWKMDKSYFTLEKDEDSLTITPNPVAICPIIDMQSIRVEEDGNLPRGLYFYAITSVGINGESLPHIFQVYAGNKENSISFRWNPVRYIVEYHIYRGTDLNMMDGYFTIYTKYGYFYDNGTGILNVYRSNPPVSVISPPSPRIIKKEDIRHFNKFFLDGAPHIAHIYITLRSREIITLDLYKMMNGEYSGMAKQFAINRLFYELEEWRCHQ